MIAAGPLVDTRREAVSTATIENAAEAIKAGQKAKVLVGGARKQTLEHLNAAAKHAGLILDQVVPGLVCTANAPRYACSVAAHG